jgi:dihydroorotase
MYALREGVENGLIDCIASHHIPQDWDNKVCEFEYAKNGMIGLETSYAVAKTALPNLSVSQLVNLFSINARRIFNLNVVHVEEESIAELTLFNIHQKILVEKPFFKGKSSNSPFIKKSLNGKVIGIINKGNLFLNK